MNSFLLLRKCPACLVRLIWMALEMGGRWRYSYCFLRCCFQDFLNIARGILVQFRCSFLSVFTKSASMWCLHIMELTRPLLGKMRFISSDKSDFYIIDYLSIAVHAFAIHISMSFSVDETLLPRCVYLFTNFRKPPFTVKGSPFD